MNSENSDYLYLTYRLTMFFEDYKLEVIRAYERLKRDGTLSTNLAKPSPGKLKKECIIVYDERYSAKDDIVLRLFFGAKETERDFRHKIKNFEIDEFRPLVNFINGRTTNPDEKNIKLLSWLIDFDKNQGISEGKHVENDSEYKVNEVVLPEETHEKEMVDTTPAQPLLIEVTKETFKPAPKLKFKIAFAMLLLIAFAVVGSYLLLNRAAHTDEKCMYWGGDEYVQVSCNQKMQGKLVIALDPVRLTHLKKIAKPDTITHKSVGKVWYVKVKGRIEYYTDSGFHPIEIDKRLMPITDYMINKYILHL
ncbi:hypothetical protein ACVWYN_001702 [Pedobacter sp. UYP24]